VWADGREVYACHDVTSIENPLPVDADRVFVVGSVTKTFTATAMMCLVAQGKVELDAPVRRYVPEFRLKDERAAPAITVLNLLNHTAGLKWRLSAETGEGDDALASYVAKMADSEPIAPPGTRASYSQVGYNLAGRVIEKVTGLSFERAVASLLFDPLGLSHTFFFTADVMTGRFAVGHNLAPDGTLTIARMSTSSPVAASKANAASSPATPTVRSPQPTWRAGSSPGHRRAKDDTPAEVPPVPVQPGLRAIITAVSPGQSQKMPFAERFASSPRTSPAKSSRRSPNRCGAEDERDK
jgi:CubicO group peptidase (beta-lactamase class C family)